MNKNCDKKCYVIMPYGGDDPEQKMRFNNVYNFIIRPAAEALGFKVIREDESANPGNITTNIVRNLSEADIVIADITNGNGNVFYELGIRHTMFKNHTILIIDETSEIKFDLAAYRAIKYRLDFNTVNAAISDIKKGIQLREKNDSSSDNLVHDVFTALPISLLDYLNNSEQGNADRINSLVQDNVTLRAELEEKEKALQDLHKQLDGAGLTRSESDWKLEDAFQKAEKAMQFSGEQAVLKLQELSQGRAFNQQEFFEYLKNVLQIGEIDIIDYVRISQMCDGKGLLPLRRLVLECAHDKAPFNDKVVPRLVDCYTDSAATYPKALALINEWIGIQLKDGQLSIKPEKCRLVSNTQLGSLFDTYLSLNKYEEIICLIENNFKKYGCLHYVILQRNLARAYHLVGHLDKAQRAFDELFKTVEGYSDPSSHQMYGHFLSAIGKHDLEYEQDEIAIALEPNECRAYFSIAADIFNYQLIRNEENKIVKVDRQTAKYAAIPFIFKALEVGGELAFVETQRMLLQNRCEEDWEILQKQIEEQSFPSYEGYKDYPLNYCIKQLPIIVKQTIDNYQ